MSRNVGIQVPTYAAWQPRRPWASNSKMLFWNVLQMQCRIPESLAKIFLAVFVWSPLKLSLVSQEVAQRKCYCLPGRSGLLSGRKLPTFLNNLQPQLLWWRISFHHLRSRRIDVRFWKRRHHFPSKCCLIYTRIHDITHVKTIICIVSDLRNLTPFRDLSFNVSCCENF